MSRRIPSITHLQFLVLDTLSAGERAGRSLRQLLVDHGVRNTAPAFYQMMARLEDAAMVEGWYDQKVVGGQLLKERHYRIARAGSRALSETRNFYLERAAGRRPARKGSHA
jgi:hypothetical protein